MEISLAKELIDVCFKAGADIDQIQSFADEIVTDRAEQTTYQKKNLNVISPQKEMLEKLELNINQLIKLKKYCIEKRRIEFLSTAFDFKNIKILKELNLTRFKIPSGEITNYPYLQKIGSFNKPIILSTGMANLSDMRKALEILMASGTQEKITILHCTSEYPAPIEEVNLNAMITIKKAFSTSVGYSDHTLGIEVAIAAVALGAKKL